MSGCRQFNELNDSPERGWEWHHYLPQCIFGDTKLGIWLTKRQHAVATAYQTLAFQYCCLFGAHLNYLPPPLHSLVIGIYRQRAKDIGTKNVQTGHLDRIRELRDPVLLVKNGQKLGQRNIDSGLWASLRTPEHQSMAGKLSAKILHSQRWMCTVTGKVSTPGGLSSWQKARNISTMCRVRLTQGG